MPYGVNAPQAWANLIADGHPGGEGVIVAVLDTGIAYSNRHPFVRSPDFTPREFVKGHDFVAHDRFPEDRNGHGTQVAGTIAEATDNGIGVTGLAYGVKLMPVRVLDSQGNGGASTIARGIRWAVNHGAQIINLSLEFTAGTVKAASIPELIGAIDYALSRNVLVVAASGNEGVGQLSFPAKVDGRRRRRRDDAGRLPRLLLELRQRADARRAGRGRRRRHPGRPPLPPEPESPTPTSTRRPSPTSPPRTSACSGFRPGTSAPRWRRRT